MALSGPQLASLKIELDTDPKALGYDTPLDTQGVADLLNTPGLSSETIANATVLKDDVLLAIDPDELPNIHVNQMQFIWELLRNKQSVDISQGSGIKALISKVFTAAAAPISRAALDALKERVATRGEVLFGINIVITHTDVGRARQVI